MQNGRPNVLRMILVLGAICFFVGCMAQERKAETGRKSSQQARAPGEAVPGPAEQEAGAVESKAAMAEQNAGAVESKAAMAEQNDRLAMLKAAVAEQNGAAARLKAAVAERSRGVDGTKSILNEPPPTVAEAQPVVPEMPRGQVRMMRSPSAAAPLPAAAPPGAARSGPGPAPPELAPSAAAPPPVWAMPTAAEPAATPTDVSSEASGRPQQPVTSKRSQAAAVVEEQENYTVVKVYYGTDRARLNTNGQQAPAYAFWLTALLASAGASLLLVAVAFRYYPTRLLRSLAIFAMGATVVLMFMTAYTALRERIPWSPAAEAKAVYGNERGILELGTCRVTIPKDHRIGQLERPSLLRLQVREDLRQHVVVLDVVPAPAEEFYAELKSCVERSGARAALVFIHGYNVQFEDAARRTAQIAYDLKYEGAPIFYSWPSQGGFLKYVVDENNAEWTVPHLKEFLAEVANRSGARQIHLIAHSMGNRALTSALRHLAYEGDKRARFHEVVLTAPDIDAEVFRRDIAPAIISTADHVTLYASSNDEALKLSKEVHGYPRAGDSDDALVVVPGVDTIDVSAVDTSFLGHSYYGSNDTVLADLFELLHDSKPPAQRRWLREQRLGALSYWIFQR